VWRRVRPGPTAVGNGEPDCRKVPVVVLPGILEPWTYLAPLGNWFAGRGHPVHYVETLGWNLADVERSARRCLAVLHEREVDGAVLVAHSKGGLVGKAVLALSDAPVGMVTVATPFGGST